jgi:putative addiction module component (TIGR02574 family)
VSRALKVPPPGFEELSVEEQIDYVQALWNVIAARPDRVAVPDWHHQLLDERLAEYERNPDEGVPWEDFRTELLGEPKPKRR